MHKKGVKVDTYFQNVFSLTLFYRIEADTTIFDNKDVKFQSLVWETGTDKDIITGLQFKNVHLDKFLQNLYGKKMLKFCWLSLKKIGNAYGRFCENLQAFFFSCIFFSIARFFGNFVIKQINKDAT